MDSRTRHLSGRLKLRNDEGGDGESTSSGIVGLAVPWDSPTRIDNFWEGTFDEQFKRGAFKRSLGQRTPKLMFEHGHHPMIGSVPLGRFNSLEEADAGLEFDADFFDNWLIEPVRQGVGSEAIDGVSIRFRPVREQIIEASARTDVEDAAVPLHIVEEAELHELGPVMFPAYEGTSVDLRSLGEVDLTNESERLRLAMVLLGMDGNADRVGTSNGPSTAPNETGAPAGRTGPASSHPDQDRSRLTRHLAQRARLHEHALEV